MIDNDKDDGLEPSDDDEIVDSELEEIEENSAQKIKLLREKLKNCEKEKMEYLETLQRSRAEFLNGKRRIEDELVRDREKAVTNQIEKLLPMCDSFHIAMSNKAAWDAVDSTWRSGIESIYNQLQSILSSYGVKEVSPEGEEFDPFSHEAMANVPVNTKEKHHKIVSVIQNGFVRTIAGKEQLIRPARVTVGEFKE